MRNERVSTCIYGTTYVRQIYENPRFNTLVWGPLRLAPNIQCDTALHFQVLYNSQTLGCLATSSISVIKFHTCTLLTRCLWSSFTPSLHNYYCYSNWNTMMATGIRHSNVNMWCLICAVTFCVLVLRNSGNLLWVHVSYPKLLDTARYVQHGTSKLGQLLLLNFISYRFQRFQFGCSFDYHFTWSYMSCIGVSSFLIPSPPQILTSCY